MGAKIFSHTHKLTMCGLKKLASGVFPESWSVGRMATAAETDPKQLEQLDRLRSEDTPATPWLHMLMSHIGSQVKKQSQSYKFKEFAKIKKFEIIFTCDTPSEVAW